MIVASPESFRGWNRSQKRPSRRERYDRWDGGLNAPKGQNNTAQGFSPGLVGKEPRPESGAGMLSSRPHLVQSIAPSAAPKSGAAFRAHSAKTESPGLFCFAPSGRATNICLASEAAPSSFHGEKTITAF